MHCLPFHALASAALLLLLGLSPAQAAPAGPASGPEWSDPQTRLSWARCVEGMQWSGTACTGQPQLFSHAQALARASARAKADGLHWRVPRVPELRRLVDKAARPPGLDPVQFPAAPRDWHWTATANLREQKANPFNYGNVMSGRSATADDTPFLLGWAVDLGSGEARGDIPKSRPLPLRLVRSLD